MEIQGFEDGDLDLLKELLTARGPSGDEREVREVCQRALEPICDEVWDDAAGNLIGVLRAEKAESEPVEVVAHMDEIAMIVKRIEEDGTLSVTNLGGDRPMSFGQSAVDVLGDKEHLTGVLSLGSLHRTGASKEMQDIREHGPDWGDVFVLTGRTPSSSPRRHHPGTRVVLSTTERHLVDLDKCMGAHFMTTGAGPVRHHRDAPAEGAPRRAQMRRLLCLLREGGGDEFRLAVAARSLPGARMIALEVGPVAKEYQTELTENPILSFGDQKGLYSPGLIDELREAATAEGCEPQLALLEYFASDASASKSTGVRPQTAVICIPTQNTHGFEVIHKNAIDVLARTLVRHFTS